MTITEFLLARIEEDEQQATALLKDLQGELEEDYTGAAQLGLSPSRLLHTKMWAIYDGQSKRRSFARGQQIAYLADPARTIAECEAKRAIIASVQPSEYWDYGAADWLCEGVLSAFAAVYKGHKDYQQEWDQA